VRPHFFLTFSKTKTKPRSFLLRSASGHTGKFSDYMVRDEKTRVCYRADHVLKGQLQALLAKAADGSPEKRELELALARVDDLDQADLTAALRKYHATAPDTGNPITDPAPFNLMFQTSIGPTGDVVGFLRPETAQGIFVNFKKLLEYNGGKLPFAAAQVGSAFRNEIAPRAGLLRVREFTLAEIEYFVKPHEKTHRLFSTVRDLRPGLLPASVQNAGSTEVIRPTLGEAVANFTIGNEALGYFMGRTYLFLRMLGIPDEHIRFRQHLSSEMAHYAACCYDAEIRTSYGWVECVGHADRTCFDLSQHSKHSSQNMAVHEAFKDGPRMVEKLNVVVKKQVVGKTFRKDAQEVIQFLEMLTPEGAATVAAALQSPAGAYELNTAGKTYRITPDMVAFEKRLEKETGESFIPHVIEPSFGIGRILYAVLEHAYWARPEDKDRGVLSLPPIIAPIKVSVFPLTSDERFAPFVASISAMLTRANISHKVDETGTAIGRRYARTDELGVPFAVTIDHQTVADNTVTLRERDTMAQVRIHIAEIVPLVSQLSDHVIEWSTVQAKFPKFVSNEKDA